MKIVALDEERLARDLYEVASKGAGPAEVGAGISRLIAGVVAHDALSLVGADPATESGRGCFSFWHQYEPGLASALIMDSYLGRDPSRPVALAGSRCPGGGVGPGGDGPSDRRTRDVLAAYGAGSELRLTLRDRRGRWGSLGLLRSEGAAPFDHDDAQRVGRLGPALITALRRYATAGPLCPSGPALPAGVIMVGPGHEVGAVSPQAHAWLDQISAYHRLPSWVPGAFSVALSLSARTHARRHHPPASLVCIPPVVAGRWIAFQGQALDADGTGDVAIVIQAATGDLVLPSFCKWYGITSREHDVIEQLLAGAAAKQIARRLGLSIHTVNDHLKAVFRKTGADGRDELIAAITR